MRVVFINISDVRGGASVAANRLRIHLANFYNVEQYYIVGEKNLTDENVFATRTEFGRILERIIDIGLSRLGLLYLFFPFSSSFLVRTIRKLKPDVISLHNTHGGYFQTDVLMRISQIAPVVWTLHDMWSFTGNAAHTFGNESWKDLRNDKHLTRITPAIGINNGRFLLRQKARIYRKSRVVLVTPSRWLLGLAVQSPVFAGKELHHIFNGIDLEVFHPLNKHEARKALGIREDAKVLMFSAGALVNNLWKGGDHLREVLVRINETTDYKIDLLIVGEGLPDFLSALPNLIIHTSGFVSSENEMAKHFSASDLFVYPTKADTLPTVLIESIACGTPCVTFDIGGSAEIIVDNFNGRVIQPFQTEAMATAVLDIFDSPDKLRSMSENARIYALKNFSLGNMAAKYYSLFSKTMELFKRDSTATKTH